MLQPNHSLACSVMSISVAAAQMALVAAAEAAAAELAAKEAAAAAAASSSGGGKGGKRAGSAAASSGGGGKKGAAGKKPTAEEIARKEAEELEAVRAERSRRLGLLTQAKHQAQKEYVLERQGIYEISGQEDMFPFSAAQSFGSAGFTCLQCAVLVHCPLSVRILLEAGAQVLLY